MPAAAEHLWQWFVELDAARSSNGFGGNPIGFGEVEAWARLTGRSPRPWEVTALRRMDALRLELAAEAARIGGEPEPDKDQVSERPMSTPLFDAIFTGR